MRTLITEKTFIPNLVNAIKDQAVKVAVEIDHGKKDMADPEAKVQIICNIWMIKGIKKTPGGLPSKIQYEYIVNRLFENDKFYMFNPRIGDWEECKLAAKIVNKSELITAIKSVLDG